jgi:hypothetical protein
MKQLNSTQRLTLSRLDDVELLLRQQKPGDRSEEDRHVAIMITELEKYRAMYIGLILVEDLINE